LAVALLVGGLSTSASAQQPQATASITGKVSARDTSEPLSDTRVILVGTSIFTVTNAEGRYYAPQRAARQCRRPRPARGLRRNRNAPVTVTAGQAATLDIQLDRTLVVPAGGRHDGHRRAASQ
jgi:hypothetical protein